MENKWNKDSKATGSKPGLLGGDVGVTSNKVPRSFELTRTTASQQGAVADVESQQYLDID